MIIADCWLTAAVRITVLELLRFDLSVLIAKGEPLLVVNQLLLVLISAAWTARLRLLILEVFARLLAVFE